ncbi:MAG TPA: HD domain-containing phosphohydrolase [Acidimicrobiia bacterium]|nr:HD domain-containing phosphohydrolase [Acidimicrobiia bacterium]
MDSRYKKTILGTVSSATGFVLTGWALWLILASPENPWPYRSVSVGLSSADWTILALFAAAYAALSFRSAEVNDRMFANSSAMVIASASMYFLASGYNAAPLVVLIAAAGPFDIEDFRRKRIFQPAINFGLLIVSALVAGTVGDLLVDPGREGVVTATTFAIVAVVGGLIAATYTITNLTLVRLSVRFAYGARNLLPWSGIWVLFASQMVMGLVGGLLGAVLAFSEQNLGNRSLLPLILIVYVTGQTVFTSYSVLRVAHESTLRGFVKTLETRDLYTRGHTERVAYFSQLIGANLGFSGTQLEHMRWAALIHDMGKLAIPIELMQKQGKLTDDEYRRLRTATHKVDDLLSEVDFLQPMVDVCSGSHPRLGQEDFGQEGHKHTASPTLEQKVLAVSDAFDAMTSVRGYRMAMSQRAALEALRTDGSALYDPEVLDALEVALGQVGETYGPPHLATPTSEVEEVRHG